MAGEKDKLSSRRRFVQRFLNIRVKFHRQNGVDFHKMLFIVSGEGDCKIHFTARHIDIFCQLKFMWKPTYGCFKLKHLADASRLFRILILVQKANRVIRNAISRKMPFLCKLGNLIKETLIKSARAVSERFFLRQKNGEQGNTSCISCFSFCMDGEKDPLFSRRRFIQRFLK